MSTLKLTLGGRGRSSCIAIDQKVVGRNIGEGDDQMQMLDSAGTLYVSCWGVSKLTINYTLNLLLYPLIQIWHEKCLIRQINATKDGLK